MSDTPGGLEIVPLTPDTWTMFDAMVARHNGIFGGCWCIWFHPDSDERGQGAEANRALKKRYVEQCKANAALVVHGGEAVAWAEYGTTCIFVDKRYRRRGLAETALLGAVDLISQAGGGVVEGYPHIPGEKKMSSSFLYNGTRAMYERCGFDFVRPKGMKNTVMQGTVAPAG